MCVCLEPQSDAGWAVIHVWYYTVVLRSVVLPKLVVPVKQNLALGSSKKKYMTHACNKRKK